MASDAGDAPGTGYHATARFEYLGGRSHSSLPSPALALERLVRALIQALFPVIAAFQIG